MDTTPAGAAFTDLEVQTADAPDGYWLWVTLLPVLSVPADEGFWVGTGPFDRIWGQMPGPGESPITVRAGDRASSTGIVVAHDARFPARVGVTTLEGVSQLASERAHLQVARSHVVLSR